MGVIGVVVVVVIVEVYDVVGTEEVVHNLEVARGGVVEYDAAAEEDCTDATLQVGRCGGMRDILASQVDGIACVAIALQGVGVVEVVPINLRVGGVVRRPRRGHLGAAGVVCVRGKVVVVVGHRRRGVVPGQCRGGVHFDAYVGGEAERGGGAKAIVPEGYDLGR